MLVRNLIAPFCAESALARRIRRASEFRANGGALAEARRRMLLQLARLLPGDAPGARGRTDAAHR